MTVNGNEVMDDGWGYPYAPPDMRISLGCYPRGESFIGAIFRNVKLRSVNDHERGIKRAPV